jgi:hypothetical protein
MDERKIPLMTSQQFASINARVSGSCTIELDDFIGILWEVGIRIKFENVRCFKSALDVKSNISGTTRTDTIRLTCKAGCIIFVVTLDPVTHRIVCNPNVHIYNAGDSAELQIIKKNYYDGPVYPYIILYMDEVGCILKRFVCEPQ